MKLVLFLVVFLCVGSNIFGTGLARIFFLIFKFYLTAFRLGNFVWVLFYNLFSNLVNSCNWSTGQNQESSQTCPDNEEWVKCGSCCQSTCEAVLKGCNLQCFRCPDACYCVKGYARKTETGPCKPIGQCSK